MHLADSGHGLGKEERSGVIKASLREGGRKEVWTQGLSVKYLFPVQVTSKSTMAKLKGLSRVVLMEVFGGVLSEEEIERMLAKRDHVVAYFDGLSRKMGLANVFV